MCCSCAVQVLFECCSCLCHVCSCAVRVYLLCCSCMLPNYSKVCAFGCCFLVLRRRHLSALLISSYLMRLLIPNPISSTCCTGWCIGFLECGDLAFTSTLLSPHGTTHAPLCFLDAVICASTPIFHYAEWDLLQEPLPIREFGPFHRLYSRARFLDSAICAIFRGHLTSPLCVTRCPAQWHNHHCHFLPFGRLLRLSISNFGAPGFLQCVQFRTCFAFP